MLSVKLQRNDCYLKLNKCDVIISQFFCFLIVSKEKTWDLIGWKLFTEENTGSTQIKFSINAYLMQGIETYSQTSNSTAFSGHPAFIQRLRVSSNSCKSQIGVDADPVIPIELDPINHSRSISLGLTTW